MDINEIISCVANGNIENRVKAYNEIQRFLREKMSDITTDPSCFPQLLPAARIRANDYNPNKVASPELDLLERSMVVDGITMPIVVVEEFDDWVVVDGFHRHAVSTTRLMRKYIPSSVIVSKAADRMASTVRHNRARGKHQVDLMAALVKGMMDLGWEDEKVANAMGMSVEELLRLRQMVGAAKMLANEVYSRAFEVQEDNE